VTKPCSLCQGENDRLPQRHCSACRQKYMVEWRRQKAIELGPIVQAVRRDRRIEQKYKVSPERLEELLLEQENACAICTTPFGESAVDRFNVDHNHSTGQVRGLLCQKCNQALGMMDDDPLYLERAARYLRSHIAIAEINPPKPKVTMASILERLGKPMSEAAE
jgi:hypothetical protein